MNFIMVKWCVAVRMYDNQSYLHKIYKYTIRTRIHKHTDTGTHTQHFPNE